MLPGYSKARQAPAHLGLAPQLRRVLEQPLVRLDGVVTSSGKLLRAPEADHEVLVVELSRLLAGHGARVRVHRLRELVLALPRRRDPGPGQRADRRTACTRERELVRGTRRRVLREVEPQVAEL